MLTRSFFAAVMSLASLGLVVEGSEWTQFRGAHAAGVSEEVDLPADWAATKNVAWKTKVPGYGWSGPIVSGDKIFVTTAVSDKQKKPSGGFAFGGGFGKGDFGKGGFGKGGFGKGGFPTPPAPDVVYEWELCCLNAADGKIVWKQIAAKQKPAVSTNPTNGYATETPATDGERVYAYFGGIGVVFCYGIDGKFVWKADVGAHPVQFGHGTASSPVLHDGRLFIQCDNERKSFLVALDAKTGNELWRTPRTERTSWSTPLVWTNKVRTEVVCVGSSKIRSYDPQSGKQLWELGGTDGQVKASPVASDELLYVGSGGGFGGFGGGLGGPRPGFGGGSKPLYAVKAGASGDITLKTGVTSSENIAWYSSQAGPSTASPLLYQGHLYVLEERGGVLSCYEAKTGKRVYRERLSGATGFTSSPWAYEGQVFCLDDSGTTHVVQAGSEFELLGQNSLGEMCWSSPAVAKGLLVLRSVDHLYGIKK